MLEQGVNSESGLNRRPVKRICDPGERKDAIEKARMIINGKLGDNSLLDGKSKVDQQVQALPTGILSLDEAIGIGGYPKGRLIEIYGAESSGKTTVALQAVAKTQKNGGYVGYIDVEQALDPEYATSIGVDISAMELAQPDSGEDAFYIVEELVKTGSFDLLVLDSVAALTPQIEIDGFDKPGMQAQMMSLYLRRLVASVNKTKTVLLFINQIRSNVNQLFAPTEITPGGVALKFYASVRIEVKSTEMIRRSEEGQEREVGKKVCLKTVKNKVASPYKVATTTNIWGQGFVPSIDIVTVASRCNLIGKLGEWYSFNGQKIGRGLFEVQNHLDCLPDILDEIEKKTRESLGFKD